MNTFIGNKNKIFFHKSLRKNVLICHIAATPLNSQKYHTGYSRPKTVICAKLFSHTSYSLERVTTLTLATIKVG
jgi:hypothetical protein